MHAKVSRLFEIHSDELEQDDKDFVERFVKRYAGREFKIDWTRDIQVKIEKKAGKVEGEEVDLLVIKLKDVDVENIDMGQGELFEDEKKSKEATEQVSEMKLETSKLEPV